jgi:hypothetical protein
LDSILGLIATASAVNQVKFHVVLLCLCQGTGEANGTIKAIDGRKKTSESPVKKQMLFLRCFYNIWKHLYFQSLEKEQDGLQRHLLP